MAFSLKNRKVIIGIPFNYSDDWIGGVYYIFNTVNSLIRLENSDYRIEFLIDKFEDLKYLENNIIYKDWSYRFFSNGKISRIEKILFRLFKIKPLLFSKIDFLYVFNHKSSFNFFPAEKIVYWIGDLQNRFYPEYFDNNSLKKRLVFQDYIGSKANSIIATSNAMKNEFEKFYPETKAKINVVPFSVLVSEINEIDNLNVDILEKYKISSKYYYTPNQFWAHKNHIFLIQTFLRLTKNRPKAILVFTGKEFDRRNPKYFESIKKLVDDLCLTDNIKFLGFISRIDQLCLLKKAHAIIQPSKYEGWSTVVEDAKILGKTVLVSDIPVHREQLDQKGIYFDLNDSDELYKLMLEYFDKDIETLDYQYDTQLLKSADRFIHAFK